MSGFAHPQRQLFLMEHWQITVGFKKQSQQEMEGFCSHTTRPVFMRAGGWLSTPFEMSLNVQDEAL